MTKPTFELIPSAKKVGKLYSPIPSNGDGDFTFSRTTEGTFTNKDGYLETAPIDVPRLDYRDTDGSLLKCPELLLEPTSTNLLLQSETFDNASWSKITSTTEANASISPNGTMTADKWSRTTVANNRIQQIITKSAVATKYSFSVYVKKANEDYFSMRMSGSYPARVDVIFNLSNGTVVSEATASGFSNLESSIVSVGNGWYKCVVSATTDATTSLSLMFSASDSPSAQVDGTGTSDNASVFLWGAQLELGITATSYIKTTTSATTRGIDVCDLAGTVDTFNSSEGVLYAEIKALSDDLTTRNICISDGTSANRVVFRYMFSSNQIQFLIVTANVVQYITTHTFSDITEMNKVALTWKKNDFSSWANGVKVSVDVAGDTPIGLNEISFTNGYDNNQNFRGRTKNIKVYDTALTDTELTELTTI